MPNTATIKYAEQVVEEENTYTFIEQDQGQPELFYYGDGKEMKLTTWILSKESFSKLDQASQAALVAEHKHKQEVLNSIAALALPQNTIESAQTHLVNFQYMMTEKVTTGPTERLPTIEKLVSEMATLIKAYDETIKGIPAKTAKEKSEQHLVNNFIQKANSFEQNFIADYDLKNIKTFACKLLGVLVSAVLCALVGAGYGSILPGPGTLIGAAVGATFGVIIGMGMTQNIRDYSDPDDRAAQTFAQDLKKDVLNKNSLFAGTKAEKEVEISIDMSPST